MVTAAADNQPVPAAKNYLLLASGKTARKASVGGAGLI